MAHHCHARGCRVAVPARLLMCAPHWRQVPKALQSAVYRTYRPGQETDRHVAWDYLRAAIAAINLVARIEGQRERIMPSPSLQGSIRIPTEAEVAAQHGTR